MNVQEDSLEAKVKRHEVIFENLWADIRRNDERIEFLSDEIKRVDNLLKTHRHTSGGDACLLIKDF